MTNVKEEILIAINTLPDNATWDDALYTLYLYSKLKKSEKDIENGKVITLEELKNHIEKLEAKYATDNI